MSGPTGDPAGRPASCPQCQPWVASEPSCGGPSVAETSRTSTGLARIVRGPDDFGRVRPGDILVCPYTGPAWTSLLRLAAGVVTEVGGVLSHAAIVARERRIPAVLGVPRATTRIVDGAPVAVDGSRGTVDVAHH